MVEENPEPPIRLHLSKLSDKVDNLTNNLNRLAKIVVNGYERQKKFNK